MQNKILLVESDPIFRDLTVAILQKGKVEFDVVESTDECRAYLAKEKPSLIIIDLEHISEGTPALLPHIRDDLEIPMIVTTAENIDLDFERIIRQKLNLVLNKPMKSTELLNVIDRLLHPDPATWFGLENYLPDAKMFRISLKRSTQIREAISAIFKKVDEWGFDFNLKFEMDLVWQEMITNALYHSHGYTEFKQRRIPIELPDPYEVVIRFGYNDNQFGISIRDFRGTLTPEKILSSLNVAVNQQQMLEKSIQTGEDISAQILDRGRGLDIMRRMAGEYYFVIENNKSTEIIIIYDRNFEKDDPYSSLKIFMLPDH
ncbi:MAG: response regulator [Leptospiraceae bacterium]|nr:response regulator [Leptospiraceae bacterium]